MTNYFWSDEAKATVADLLMHGKSASQIGKVLGITRNAVLGKVHRDAGLRAIGLAGYGERGKRAKLTQEQIAEHRRRYDKEYNKTYQRRPRSAKNVIQFPEPRSFFPADPQKPRLSVVSNNVPLMVQDWLARNGGARKFCERETSHPWDMRSFLAARGVETKCIQNKWSVMRNERWRACRWPDIMALVDEIRIAEGLPPFAIGVRMEKQRAVR